MSIDSQKSATRMAYIDGLRGLAIFMVLAYHIWLWSGSPFPFWWNPVGRGYIGVNLFLLLSGYCVYWPFVRPSQSEYRPSLIEFGRRRARRIIPPYLTALGLFTVGSLLTTWSGHKWADSAGDTANILRSAAWHATMLHNLRPEHVWTIAGPFWSLALESSLYVAMPLLVVTARRWGILRAVGLAATTTLAYRFTLDTFIGGAAGWESVGHDYTYTLCYFLPGRWLEFALGMWAASLIASQSTERSSLPLGALSVVFLVLAWCTMNLYGTFNPVSDPLCGIGFLFLLLSCARGQTRDRRTVHVKLLNQPVLIKAGIMSYSIYLIHQPILKLMMLVTSTHLNKKGALLALGAIVYVPLMLLVSWYFHKFVERPFMNSSSRSETQDSNRQSLRVHSEAATA